jgi:hypothetical protein
MPATEVSVLRRVRTIGWRLLMRLSRAFRIWAWRSYRVPKLASVI